MRRASSRWCLKDSEVQSLNERESGRHSRIALVKYPTLITIRHLGWFLGPDRWVDGWATAREMGERKKPDLKWLVGIAAASSPVIGGAILAVVLIKRRHARRCGQDATKGPESDGGNEVKLLTGRCKSYARSGQA